MSTTHSPRSPITGVLLAGGKSRRMGGADKAFVRLGGKPLIEHVIARAAPQVARLLLSINGEADRYRDYPLVALPDQLTGFGGPLVGILSAMRWVQNEHADCNWLASFATDTPFIPTDMVARLRAAAERNGNPIACPRSSGRTHPVCALWSLGLLSDLERFLIARGEHQVQKFLHQFPISWVDFEPGDRDPFFNINTPEDLATAAQSMYRDQSQ